MKGLQDMLNSTKAVHGVHRVHCVHDVQRVYTLTPPVEMMRDSLSQSMLAGGMARTLHLKM
jgi:hypothetical protein